MSVVERAYKKMKRSSGNLLRQTGGSWGLYDNFYREARGQRILVYHGICNADHTRFNPIFLTRKMFESQLRFFKEYFNVLTLDEVFEGKGSPDRFNVCLSFDDGFANNFEYVLPLLEKYELPATFFITAIGEEGFEILWNDYLNIVSRYGPETITYKDKLYRKNRFGRYEHGNLALAEEIRAGNFEVKKEMMAHLGTYYNYRERPADQEYWKLLSEEQVRIMAQSKWVTIGSHGYYHNDLAKISHSLAEDEMIRSKKYLERVIGKEINAFAYPYGSFTHELNAIALRIGYTQLLGADSSEREENSFKTRFTINPFMSVHNQVYSIIRGNYDHWK